MGSTTAPLTCQVNITAIGIGGNSVACQFNQVYRMNIDWTVGKLMIQDVTGTFYFGLTEITTFTYTVNGTNTAVVIS